MPNQPNSLGFFHFHPPLAALLQCALAVALCLLLPAAAQPKTAATAAKRVKGPLQVVRITPAGEDVPSARQIVFQFDRPVVPLGRMERDASEIPIIIEPAPACRWRWLNPSALACQLDEKDALAPATRYRIIVRPGITSLDKTTLSGDLKHVFITQRPRIASAWFRSWLAPGMPQIGIRVDQPVKEDSLSEHLFFQTESGERIAARVEKYPWGEEPSESEKDRLWLLSPSTELGADQAVTFRVDPGIVSIRGPEAGIENRIVVAFQTFPEFRFAGMQCHTLAGEELFVDPGKAAASQPRCNPVREISMLFSAPVIKEEVQQGILISPSLAQGRTDFDPWSEVYTYSRLSEPHQKGKTYPVPLPEVLKAYADYHLRANAGAFKDEFGRPLAAAIDIKFRTDHRPPDFYLFKRMPVLEKGLDTDVPLLVTNLDRLKIDYRGLTSRGTIPSKTKELKVGATQDVPALMPLGIRNLLPTASGLIQGQLTTRPQVPDKDPLDAWFFAQVTPFHVHAKLGHHNTLVWITDLQTGQPVPGVEVQIHKASFPGFSEKPQVLAHGVTGEAGTVVLPGSVTLDPDLTMIWAYEHEEPRLFVQCKKDEDLAILPLTSEFEVASEGANREYMPQWIRPRHGHIRAWGATAQGVYKVGDTVQYKIYVRDQDNRRFVPPPGRSSQTRFIAASELTPYVADGIFHDLRQHFTPGVRAAFAGTATPAAATDFSYTLKVVDPTDKTVYERKNFQLSEFGACDGEFAIPKNGAVGWYRFVLAASFATEEWEPMRVLVSDFTPSPFKVTSDLNGELFGIADTVKVTTQAKLHAGGPYARAGVRITATLQARPFIPQDPKARGFQFDVLSPEEYGSPPSQTLYQTEGTLDANGVLETQFTVTQTPVIYGLLSVESAVRDERGKFVANRASAAYVGRNQYVGLSQQDWVLEEAKPAKVGVLVVDRYGKAVAGTPVRLEVERQITKASRVKGAGDAYLTHYAQEWVEVEKRELNSTSDPLDFEFTPQYPGAYRVTARIGEQPDEGSKQDDSQPGTDKDRDATAPVSRSEPAANPPSGHETAIQRWVVGKGPVLWESVPGNSLNVFPEKEDYRVGETVRLLVQNPFPGARALISVERFGTLQSWVKILENSTEVIEFPVLPDYLPGFYVSVLIVSPRVDKPAGTEAEDLGKPTFRLGYAKISAKDPCKEIEIQAKPEKEVYKPRDTVTIELQARPRNLSPGETSPPIELAVSVLDESVFDLLRQGKDAFDPYRGFYSLDSLDLTNYNLIMQLIGRQKLEKKGANPGGGGGADLALRSLFKFVSYWNPSLPVDSEGKARIQFQLPDNLTGWRVLAMAVTPEDRMGLGDTVFRTNQSTEIRPVLPNQVNTGDSFEAGFSIMNRTETARTLEVTIQAQGAIEFDDRDKTPGAEPTKSASQQLVLQPYERSVVRHPMKAAGRGEIVLTARAGDTMDQDALRKTVPVLARESLEIAASYGTTDGAEAKEAIVFPDDMRAEVGKISVTASPTAIADLDGAFKYMRDYPYSCWEQILSKGVMAAYHQRLKPYLGRSFAWEQSAALPEKTLSLAAEHQAANGGMAFYVPKDEYVSPYLSAFTALAFNWLRSSGYAVPEHVETKLHEYLLNLLRRDAMPDFYSKGMATTVRATALAALAQNGKVTLGDLERHMSHLGEMSLFGKAQFLQALIRIPGTAGMQKRVLKNILNHADQSSGSLIFSETLDSRYQHLLTSSIRDNAAILSALIDYHSVDPARSTLGDIPFRLMRNIMQSRRSRDHWLSTQENLFAVKALDDFSSSFEAVRPDLTVNAWLDTEKLGEASFTDLANPPAIFERPNQAADVGRQATLRIEHQGSGRLYYGASLSFAPEALKPEAVNAGIEIHREYNVEREKAWVLLQSPMEIKSGELVRVDLYVSIPAERHFVVVEDPVPGGLEPVNRELATASEVDADKGEGAYPGLSYRHRFDDWIDYGYSFYSFYHKELRHNCARFYSEVLPPGRYHLSYVAQAIAPGEFSAMPARAEEMYDPDVYGKGVPAVLRVRAAD